MFFRDWFCLSFFFGSIKTIRSIDINWNTIPHKSLLFLFLEDLIEMMNDLMIKIEMKCFRVPLTWKNLIINFSGHPLRSFSKRDFFAPKIFLKLFFLTLIP